jgi:hypothetical protein
MPPTERRQAARNSAGIKCENIASDGTTSMQLTSSRERSFMVSRQRAFRLVGEGVPGMPDRVGRRDDSGLPAGVQPEIQG